MRIRVRYFARYRSLVGKGEEELEVPDGITVRQLVEILMERHQSLNSVEMGEINVSRNGRYARLDDTLKDGDVIAIFPPVSGG